MSKPFRPSVLIVSPDPSVPGGVSVFVECLKRHIAGCSVTPFYVGGTGRRGESPFSVAQRLAVVPLRLMRFVKQQKFAVVHLNPSFDVRAMIRDGLSLLALRAIGYRRILFYIHGWDAALQRVIAANQFFCRVAAWALNGAGLITVLDDDFRDGLIAIGVDPGRVIVTRTMFEGSAIAAAQAQSSTLRRRFILFLSRFDPEKGGRELLQAFAALAPRYPDLDLVMAGDGADADYLRARAATLGIVARVTFTGYIGGAQKARLLCDCALFALPTYYRSEGMPVAVLEAMGAGKALLVGAAGALPSIVADGVNGVVLDRVTPDSVEAGLRRLLDDESFAAAAGTRNAEIAWSRFEARIVTAEIESYYHRVIAC